MKAFENICGQMLMDVQERLVYRTYIYIKNDIFMYNAASGDLAYPEKLEMMEVSGGSMYIFLLPLFCKNSRTEQQENKQLQAVLCVTMAGNGTFLWPAFCDYHMRFQVVYLSVPSILEFERSTDGG